MHCIFLHNTLDSLSACETLAASINLFITILSVFVDLGDGWFRYGKAAIKLFQELKNWTDARLSCQALGGDLLSISSSHENDFVYDVFVKKLNLTYGERGNVLLTTYYCLYIFSLVVEIDYSRNLAYAMF